MKPRFAYLLFLSLAVYLSGCDVIQEEDRYIQTEELGFTNKIVLLEEFTGHKCTNCPAAAEVVEWLAEWCEGHLVTVSIHAGAYANTAGSAWKTDFQTEDGDAYHAYFSPDVYPSAMIDRSKNDARFTIGNTSLYSAKIIEQLSLVSPADITLSVNAAREVVVNIVLSQAIPEAVSLQVWITEDNIQSPQLMPDNSINYEYIHHHVFRSAVNGTWGEALGNSFPKGEVITRQYPFMLQPEWKEENCSLVAFLYHTETKEILQSVSYPL